MVIFSSDSTDTVWSNCTLHYITLETICSGLSKSNLKDHSATEQYWGAVPWRARLTVTASLNLMRSGARSQWKLARASVICSERRRPAIDQAAALRTDWRRLSRQAGRPANVALPQSSRDRTRATTSDWYSRHCEWHSISTWYNATWEHLKSKDLCLCWKMAHLTILQCVEPNYLLCISHAISSMPEEAWLLQW